jgi:archaellin
MAVTPDNSLIINYVDPAGANDTDVQDWTTTLVGTERGTEGMLDADEQMVISVPVPSDATLDAYSTFTIQVVPPKGAAITITRTLPGALKGVMDLH